MMRMVDADRLDSIMQDVERYFRQSGFSDGSLPLDICKMIVEAVLNKSPTVDTVPVVRCRECKHRHSSEFCECRPEDAFCSDGEKMDEPSP